MSSSGLGKGTSKGAESTKLDPFSEHGEQTAPGSAQKVRWKYCKKELNRGLYCLKQHLVGIRENCLKQHLVSIRGNCKEWFEVPTSMQNHVKKGICKLVEAKIWEDGWGTSIRIGEEEEDVVHQRMFFYADILHSTRMDLKID